MTPAQIPVTLLTGFLGSGKTTLLNCLVRRRPYTAVIVNEFGEVGLDHRLLEETRGPLALLSGGCVCCQLQGTLGPTLKNLWLGRSDGKLPAFRRVVVETTGIADPAPIVETLLRDRWVSRKYVLDGVVTTVDAMFAGNQLDAHFEAVRQVSVADHLVLTKTDLVPSSAAEKVRERLAALNPAAAIAESINGAIDPDFVFEVGGYNPKAWQKNPAAWLSHGSYRPLPSSRAGLGRRATLRDAVHATRIQSFSVSFDAPLDWAGLEDSLATLIEFAGHRLLRMKAIVDVAGHPSPVALHAVQHVVYEPGELPGWPDDERTSRFVFITADLDEALMRTWLSEFERGVGRTSVDADASQTSRASRV